MGVAAVAVVGASITGADAHIPGVGNGLPPTTNAPDLRSVKIVRLNLTEADSERALYCFDQSVANAGPAAAYGIQGYDSAKSFTPTSVSRSTDADNCVLADFSDGADLSQGTTGVVRPGAVSNTGTVANNYASEPLEGSAVVPAAGATTGPDLVAAEPDIQGANNYSVLYTYDEPLNPNPAVAYNAANFIVFDNSGTPVPGVSVDTPNPTGKSIRINYGTFNTKNGNQVYTSNFGAVQDRPMTVGGVTGSAQGIFGSNTARPRVTGAAPSSASTYKVTFSETVNTPLAPRFFAVTDIGTGFPATGVSSNGDNSVNVTFPAEVARDADNVVRIFAGAGAVQSASNTGSIISQANTSTPRSAPGFTNGPDLLGVAIDAGSRTVTYRFDEAVNSEGALPAPTAFRGVAADGSVQTGSSNVAADGNNYNVIFPTTLGAAVAFEVNAGVLTDRTTRPNPIGSVSSATEQATPTTTQPTGTTPPPPPPPVKRAKFRSSISFKIKSRTRYSGRVSSSGAGCKSGRRVSLKRSGKTIRKTFTKGNGTYTLARSKGTRGKKGVYAVVSQRSTSTKVCTARGSKKLRRG